MNQENKPTLDEFENEMEGTPVEETCDQCNGSGEGPADGTACDLCKGKGSVIYYE